jgi:hypothetical protein
MTYLFASGTSSGFNWTIVLIAIPAIGVLLGGLTLLIRGIFKLGQYHNRFTSLEKFVDETIKPALEQLEQKIDNLGNDLSGKIESIRIANASDKVTESHSPRQLNDYGKRVLEQSGVKDIVEAQFDALVKKVRSQKPQNAYQGEQLILNAVEALRANPELKNKIEDGAYQSGDTVDTVLLVGGVYIRDRILEKLDLKPEDIDNNKPATTAKPKTG